MAQDSTFGLGWLGVSSTIQHTPLLNMMVMCGDASPDVDSICDCTDHMPEGGKKDTMCIVEIFQEKVNEFEEGRNTHVFSFDSASNVQKANQILCQTFPRACCFHGGELALSLFFRDLSKMKLIQVR